MTPPEQARPNPDDLLNLVKAEELSAERKTGKLKIFFGASAGVGKTYAMLGAAHDRLKEGVDIMLGLVETHGREETEKLVGGLPSIPLRESDHRGIILKEFDLDAALARKPNIIVLDELAHTNAPGSRHPKRWQDVEELLEAGINVYTSLNVQHLESLNDLVAKVTGVWVKETVPDSLFDRADEISLIDISSDELLKRLQEGKVYVAEQAKKRAAHNFFRKGNLIALREMALRRTAERVDEQMDSYKTQGLGASKGVTDRIMVCVGPGALSMKLVRAAKRMSTGLKASWVAIYIENDRHYKLSKEEQGAVERTLRLAEQMGGKTEIIQGNKAADEILKYAVNHGITRIVIGKSKRPRWKDVFVDSLVNELSRRSQDIEMHIISSEEGAEKKRKFTLKQLLPTQDYGVALMVLVGCTALATLLKTVLEPVNIAMIYLIGVVIVAARLGRGPAMTVSFLSVFIFNYFHVAPYFSVRLQDFQYLVTLVVMLLTSAIISSQTSRLRLQYIFSRKREKNTAALYAMTRELAHTRGRENISEVTMRHISEVFDSDVRVWLVDENDMLYVVHESKAEASIEAREQIVAQWAFDHCQHAGKNTGTLPSSQGFYIPLIVGGVAMGVVGLIPRQADRHLSVEQVQLLEAFIGQASAALERASVAEMAEKNKVEAEGEKLRNLLLGNVSNDLRMPIQSIVEASSALQKENADSERSVLAENIRQEAERLAQFAADLVAKPGIKQAVTLNRYEINPEQVVTRACTRLQAQFPDVMLARETHGAIPKLRLDSLLMEQALSNLLLIFLNNSKATQINCQLRSKENQLQLSCFASLQSVQNPILPDENSRELWLGEMISRSVIHAHGGKIQYSNANNEFTLLIVLPL
jgi:two-component system sensor histidine kinase KdpD